MHMEIFYPIIVIFLFYGWPLLIGGGCLVASNGMKFRAFFYGVGKAYLCLLIALLLSSVTFIATDAWVETYANSWACIEQTSECDFWVLQTADWLETWQFMIFEILAFLCAVFVAMKQVQAFNKRMQLDAAKFLHRSEHFIPKP